MCVHVCMRVHVCVCVCVCVCVHECADFRQSTSACVIADRLPQPKFHTALLSWLALVWVGFFYLFLC